tara:strand:- start:1662 stop:2546 length:885 start_codon:yes stop_codon:yes gene_type:complete
MNEITKKPHPSEITWNNSSDPIRKICHLINLNGYIENEKQRKMFISNLVSSCGKDSFPAKQGCQPYGIVLAALKASEYNVNIDGVESCIVPYNGKPALVIMPTGMLKIIHSNPDVLHFSTHLVYKDEHFVYRPRDIENPIEHTQDHTQTKLPKDLIGAYCYYITKRGSHLIHGAYFMNESEINQHKACSKNHKMWNERKEDMWIKTVIKKTMKFAQLGIQLQINEGFEDDQGEYESTPTSSYTPSAPAPQTPPPAQKTQPVTPAASESVTINQEPAQQQDVEQTNVFDSFGDEV